MNCILSRALRLLQKDKEKNLSENVHNINASYTCGDEQMTEEETKESTEEVEEEPKKTKEAKTKTIEDLPGIGPTSADKLHEAGFKTLESIAVASTGELIDAAGIGEGTAKKAIISARNSLKMGYESADKIMKRREKITRLTTGSTELDNLIGGGLETQAITECYGKFGSGKSQLAFQLAVNVQLPIDKGGLNGPCLFVDTESTFRPERIVQIAEGLDLDPQKVLKNIFVSKAYNAEQQMLTSEKANEIVEEKNIKLIIIDSLTSRFRSEYTGRGTLADRQQKLNKHMHTLLRWAELYNIPIYVTNQVMSNPALLFGDPTTPIGGNIVGHASAFRIYLRKSKGEKRIARLVDSPSMPEAECLFRVTEKGVHD